MPDSTRSGPVRSEAARQAILSATVDLLAERGYEQLTIEGIAQRAGVGKQTIYRWWRSKGEILAECLLDGRIFPGELEIPNTGDTRRDLGQWLRTIAHVLGEGDGDGAALGRSLIAAATQNAEVGRRLREAISGDGALSSRLHAAIGSESNLRPGAPVDEIAEALVGVVVLRALSRTPLDDAAIDALLGVVLGVPIE